MFLLKTICILLMIFMYNVIFKIAKSNYMDPFITIYGVYIITLIIDKRVLDPIINNCNSEILCLFAEFGLITLVSMLNMFIISLIGQIYKRKGENE